MDYPSTRKPVDQREFIVTAFAIDVYNYLDKGLDIDVMLECLTNTIISSTILDSASYIFITYYFSTIHISEETKLIFVVSLINMWYISTKK